MEQTPRQLVGEIIWFMMLISVGLFLWFTIGADNWRTWWTWQIEPYSELWDNYGADFFAGEGQAYRQIAYLIAAITIIFTSMRLAIWISKILIAAALSTTALWYFGLSEIPQPPLTLIIGAVAAALLLVGMMLRRNGG